MPLLNKEYSMRMRNAYGRMKDFSDGCLDLKQCGGVCCTDTLGVQYNEFAYLMDGLREQMPEEAIGALFEKKTGLAVGPMKSAYITENGYSFEQKAHFCRLLDGSKCLVYDRRPSVCRSYFHSGTDLGLLNCISEETGKSGICEENKRVGKLLLGITRELDIPDEWKNVERKLDDWFRLVILEGSP